MIFALGTFLFISDLLFPVWLIGIIIYLKRKKWAIWKAWGVASTFCLGQAYFVAKFIGWNVGAYTLIWPGSLISSLFFDLPSGTTITSYLTPFQLFLVFGIAPPVTIIIIPTLILFFISKVSQNNNQFDKDV